MNFFQKIKTNLLNIHNSTLDCFESIFVLITLWWGIGGMLGIRFIILYLNYLCDFPGNILVTAVGLIGLSGIGLQNSKLNLIFGICNIFLFSSVAVAFWRHASVSMSAGTYGMLLIGAIFLVVRLQAKKEKNQRLTEFLEKQ